MQSDIAWRTDGTGNRQAINERQRSNQRCQWLLEGRTPPSIVLVIVGTIIGGVFYTTKQRESDSTPTAATATATTTAIIIH
jgi:hypothetical protein